MIIQYAPHTNIDIDLDTGYMQFKMSTHDEYIREYNIHMPYILGLNRQLYIYIYYSYYFIYSPSTKL